MVGNGDACGIDYEDIPVRTARSVRSSPIVHWCSHLVFGGTGPAKSGAKPKLLKRPTAQKVLNLQGSTPW